MDAMTNPTDEWVVVYTSSGSSLSEVICQLLNSFGIETKLSQESAGKAYGLTIGSLGQAFVLVRQSQAEYSKLILQEYEKEFLDGNENQVINT